MNKLSINEKSIFSGKYKITRFKAGTDEVISESDWIKNLVVANANHGINLVAKQLGGDTTYPLEITRCELGIGTTPPSVSDTELEDTVAGGGSPINKSSVIIGTSSVEIGFFVPNIQLPDAEYTEFGLFCGTQLFARSIIDPAYSKSGAEDIKVDYTINITTG